MNSADQERFENYRRERNRRRLGAGPVRDLGKNAHVLRQLEEAEAREVRNEQLTREVQEFFEDATRTAATIVTQVSAAAEEQQQQQVAREMSEFLTATIQRAQLFMQMMGAASGGGDTPSLQDLQPRVQNLVGTKLDEFRWAGTAQLSDQHIGMDPFHVVGVAPPQQDPGAAPPAAAAAPQSAQVAPPTADAAAPQPPAASRADEVAEADAVSAGFEHLPLDVEHVGDDDQEDRVAAEPPEPSPIEQHLVAESLGIAESDDGAQPETGAADAWFARLVAGGDRERLKIALKALVHHEAMSKDEARAIYHQTVHAASTG